MSKFKKFFKFIPFLFFFVILGNYKLVYINGNSMLPTLPNGSYAIVDTNLYKLFQINRGDILLFRTEKEEVVKKIIGFPNEKIEVDGKEINLANDEIYIIGINLAESIDSRNYGPIFKKQIMGKVVLNF
jgi:signal peptidase I